MEEKYFIYPDGRYYGSFYGGMPEDETLIEVPSYPPNGRMYWNGAGWYFKREDALSIAKERLNIDFTNAMQRLQAPWPLLEVLTWDKQSYEAARWAAAPADSKPETPFLTSLFEKCAALGAEDTFEALVSRVRANDRMYTEAVTSIMAIRHVAESQIEASEEPMSVTWQFP